MAPIKRLNQNIKGIVLAGGMSSRFGEDKALARVDGEAMIHRAVQLLKELDLDPCVITRTSRDYSFLKCRIENDLIPDKGPLGGMYTAFSLFEKVPLLILTCDMPLVSREMLCALKHAHTFSDKATLYQSENGKPEPFPGIYEPELKLLARRCINSNSLSMWRFIRKIKQKNILSLPSNQDVLVNINYRKDLQKFL